MFVPEGRIDIAPEDKGNGVIRKAVCIHSVTELAASRDLVHPLLVLGFDVMLSLLKDSRTAEVARH